MEKQINEPQESILTSKMDVGTNEFDDFQAILLKRSNERSENQRRKIELLTLRYQMEDYVNTDANEMKETGDFLKIILKSLKIQQNKFAEYIGMKPSNFSKLLNGERPVNYNQALIFGKLFNHNPMLWIEIQAKNELRQLFRSNKNKYAVYSLNDLIQKQKKHVSP